tara:strand:+ start:388 stop:660 length:273 start_codon:yes stop_codon:yes gene_type:complete
MNKYFLGLILLVIGFHIYLTFKKKNISNMKLLHSSKMNRSFYVNGYNNDKISEIQLSINERDNKYNIKLKENKYYLFKNNRNIKELSICS